MEDYWHGKIDDIDNYMFKYFEDDSIEIHDVFCNYCLCRVSRVKCDAEQGTIWVKCVHCGAKKFLFDSEDFWKESKPIKEKCPVCKKGKQFNLKIGFSRRENGDVKWVYIGNRCARCSVLGSFVDWKIDYGPTTEQEKKI